MNRTLLLLFLLAGCLAGLSFPAAAEPAAAGSGFVYRGCLRADDDSVPSAESYRAEFRIWDCLSGGAQPLWGRTRLIAPDPTGQFVVHLSDEGEPLEDARFDTLAKTYAAATTVAHYYLGVTILPEDGTEPAEIAPRQEILPVPLVAFADTATASAGDFSVPGNLAAAAVAAQGDLTAPRASFQTVRTQDNLIAERSGRFGGPVSIKGAITGDGILSLRSEGSSFEGPGTLPKGAVLPFFGDTIPDGWALCDGADERPDLTGRFVQGTTTASELGLTGGAETVALLPENLPAHTHGFRFLLAESRTLGFAWSVKDNDGIWAKESTREGTTTVWGRETPEAHDNIPPFCAVRYIIKIR